eukprot:2641071-Rhodomonas_salina.1
MPASTWLVVMAMVIEARAKWRLFSYFSVITCPVPIRTSRSRLGLLVTSRAQWVENKEDRETLGKQNLQKR